jgi:hypothetical protein
MARFRSAPHSSLRAGPPPEVLAEVDAAWERATELARMGYDVHFVRRRGGIAAELRHGRRRVQRMSACDALDFVCGGWTPPADDMTLR